MGYELLNPGGNFGFGSFADIDTNLTATFDSVPANAQTMVIGGFLPAIYLGSRNDCLFGNAGILGIQAVQVKALSTYEIGQVVEIDTSETATFDSVPANGKTMEIGGLSPPLYFAAGDYCLLGLPLAFDPVEDGEVTNPRFDLGESVESARFRFQVFDCDLGIYWYDSRVDTTLVAGAGTGIPGIPILPYYFISPCVVGKDGLNVEITNTEPTGIPDSPTSGAINAYVALMFAVPRCKKKD